MKTNVIQIGNSKGIRIPKTLLDQCHLANEVELEPRENALVIRSISRKREGWEEAFARMAREGDDSLLDHETFTSWDRSEWVW